MPARALVEPVPGRPSNRTRRGTFILASLRSVPQNVLIHQLQGKTHKVDDVAWIGMGRNLLDSQSGLKDLMLPTS